LGKKQPLLWTVPAACVWAATVPAFADNVQMAADCVAAAVQIQNQAGVRMVETTHTIVFDPGLPATTANANEMTVDCQGERRDYAINLWWTQPEQPPARFFDIIGRAGFILTGDAPIAIMDGVRACHEQAKRAESELGTVFLEKTRIYCSASNADGAANARVFIRIPGDAENEQ
jgi:hypothetical protein